MARKKSGRKKKRKFKYQQRSKEDLRKRQIRGSGLWDSTFLDQFQVWKPQEGKHRLRVLPATWPGASHYGFDVWTHFQIGPDKQAYLCTQRMKGDTCCICEERRKASGIDEKYAKALTPARRVLMWVIVRGKEDEGPQLYSMPKTMDEDITTLSEDESGECLWIDKADKGYDIIFSRTGTTKENTKYSGVKVARKSTPLSDDEEEMDAWLDFITENPLPDVLRYYDQDYIERVFSGGSAESADEDEDEEETPTRTERKSGRRKRPVIDEDDDDNGDDDDDDDDTDDDDTDDDDDDTDDDDDDDDTDDDDEGLDDDDESLDDDPDDDDDSGDDDDDDDSGDDDEDEAPPPRKRGKGKGKGKKKTPVKGGLRRRRRK
jgi:hypothetical protein